MEPKLIRDSKLWHVYSKLAFKKCSLLHQGPEKTVLNLF